MAPPLDKSIPATADEVRAACPIDFAIIDQCPRPARRRELLSDAQATQALKKSLEKISKTWTMLNRLLGSHEPTIQARWTKKSADKRQALLKRVQPDLPTQHRPEWIAFGKRSERLTISEKLDEYGGHD